LRWSQTKWGNRVLFPVHDEICVFVPEAEAEEATATLVDCMATTYMGVPILAAPSAPSTYWADAA
jgi:DNA polymerase I-like protein with 3'-5' exonuclease and polymerase domains